MTRAKRKGKEKEKNVLLKWPLWIIVLCGFVGGALGIYATGLAIEVASGELVEPTGCSVNEWISCEAVHVSSFATMFDLPVAWWGVLFYAWIVFAALFSAFSKAQERVRATLAASLILGLGAVLFSLYKATHLYQLGVLCPVCVSMYLLNFLIVFFIIKTLQLRLSNLPQFLAQYVRSIFGQVTELSFSPQPVLFLALVTSLFSLGYIGLKNYEERGQKETGIQRAVEDHFKQKQLSLAIHPDAAVWGNPEAELSVIEFSDFECPGCRFSAFHLRNILFEYRNRVRLFFMNYPLDGSINPYVQSSIHPHAGLAARAGVCAQQFGDFWDFHDDLFRRQKQLNRNLILQLAAERNWNIREFEACVDSESTIGRVKRDIELGKEIGVRSTPTLFINGRLVKFWNSNEFVRAVVREEVKKLQ